MKRNTPKAKSLPKRKPTTRKSTNISALSANPRKPVQLKRIVVALDFSACSKAALRHAVDLADLHDASLLLVTVVEPPRVFAEPNVQPYADWDKAVVSDVRTQLDELVTANVPISIPVEKEVSIGKASFKIIAAAATSKADLIIIGTHGYTGLKHVFLGSTAEKVVRHSHCSVLVVHESDGRPWTPGGTSRTRILVPVDFSAHSKRAAAYASDWSTTLDADVELLNVVPTHYPLGDYDLVNYENLTAEQSASAARQLDRWAKAFSCRKAPVGQGRPATAIVDFAQNENVDLIVIATRGQTGLKHLLLGSTTEEVVRRAHCPVLVLR